MQIGSKPSFKLRVAVLGLILDANDVLLIHQINPPEPDRWDLPGGGLEPWEMLMAGLAREVREETGVTDFQVKELLTIVETFMEYVPPGGTDYQINIIYRCTVPDRSAILGSSEVEVGKKGIQWLPIDILTAATCTTRTWKALQSAGVV